MADARVFQEVVEAAVTGQTTSARVLQEQVNVAVTGQTTDARVLQSYIEVAVWPAGVEPLAGTGNILSREAFGQLRLFEPAIAPTSITSAQSVSAVALIGFIELDGIAPAGGVGAPTVEQGGGLVVEAIAIASDEDVGSPGVSGQGYVAPDAIVPTASVGQPTLVQSGFVEPDGIASDVAIGEPTILLDTTAPTVTWGAQTGTTAGELLQLAYTSDEPIAAAQLTTFDGTVLALTVGDAILSVLLPANTAAGAASVLVADAAGNERNYPALVVLQGVVVPVPRRPGGGPPRRRPARRRSRTIINEVTIVARSSTIVTARVQSIPSELAIHRASVITATQTIATTSTARSSSRLRSAVAPTRVQLQASEEHAVQRRDGPDFEELLLLQLL